MNMNKFIGIGRLTKDPSLEYSQNGTAIVTFTIAIKRQFSKNKEADFLLCKAFKQQAENLAQYQKKGNLIAIEARIQTGSYEKDGKTIYTTEIIADNIQYLESKSSNQSNPQDNDPFKGQQEISSNELPF
jgi:single-strand DNA-binding protein